MPNLERDDIESSLTKKGFVEVDGKDHRYYRLYVENKDTGIYTKTSRGGSKKYKTLGDGLVSEMAKQVKLTTKQFRELVDCSLTGEQYLDLLRAREEL